MSEIDEACPRCGAGLELTPVENCSCHINPPCGACTSRLMFCGVCDWEEEPVKYVSAGFPGLVAVEPKARTYHDFGDGKRIFDYHYDARSGSTMVYRGYFEGPVTAKDIIDFFGDGSFGHRGPHFNGKSFTYTKITD